MPPILIIQQAISIIYTSAINKVQLLQEAKNLADACVQQRHAFPMPRAFHKTFSRFRISVLARLRPANVLWTRE